MMVTSMIIAVPTGIKVFSWLATMWEGRINFATPMLFALGFVSMFVIGGLSGIYLAAVPIDIHASDTYFVVAHIHYVLFGGSLFTIFAGIYYWFPKMTGRMYDERLGKLHFWLTFIGFNLTFFPMHYLGLHGMNRRVADYAPKFADLNLFISIASFGLGASTIVFLYNMITSMRFGPPAPANPWRALTLEWQVSSPPPIFNFDEVPQVVGGPYEYGVPGREARGAAAASAPPSSRRCTGDRRRARGGRAAHPRRRERDRDRAPAHGGARAPRGGGADPRHRDRADQPPARGLRRLRGHAAGRGGPAARPDAREAPRGGHPRARARRRHRPAERAPRRDRPARARTRSSSRRTRSRSPAGCGGTSSTRCGTPSAAGPFEHIVADPAEEAAGEQNVLVVANETLLGEPLLERIRERAAQSPASFLIVSPQSDPTQGSHPEAERRLRRALAELRSTGIEAHGQIAHPDPYAAAMQAVRDERVDEIIVSTFPQQRSGWLRRDLVGRLRNDSGVPVDHIVVDQSAAEAQA